MKSTVGPTVIFKKRDHCNLPGMGGLLSQRIFHTPLKTHGLKSEMQVNTAQVVCANYMCFTQEMCK